MAVPVISFVYTIQDGDGDKSVVQIKMPRSLVDAIDDAAAIATGLGTLLNAIITGAIVDVSACVGVDLDAGWTDTPGATSDIQHKALFSFRTEENFPTLLSIPTFDLTKFSAGSKDVNLADSDVDAFVTAITDGITVSAVNYDPSDRRGDDVVSLDAAREQFRRTRGRRRT